MATGADNIIGNFKNVDTFLTNYSQSYFQDATTFLYNSAATVIPVTEQAGKFVIYPRSYFLRDEMAPRGLGAAPVQVSYGTQEGTYVVDEFALEHFIDDRQRAGTNLPSVSLDLNATRLLTSKAQIRRDRRWATSFFTTGIWGSDYTGVDAAPTGDQFLRWDQASANPVTDVLRAKTAIGLGSGKEPNTMVVGMNVYNHLIQSAVIQDLYKYTRGGVLTADILAAVFGVERFVVARSVYNSAAEKITPDAENIQWIVDPNSVWVGYIERTPSLDSPTAIAMFAWTGYLPGVANQQGGVISRGRDDRSYSDFFHIRDATDFKAVAPDLGAFFSGAVSGAL